MAQLESAIKAAGAAVVRSGPDTVKAGIAIDRLDAAAQLPAVSRIRSVLPPREKNVTTTEGVSTTLANAWHTAGFRGSGVKVAVVDIGFANLATLKAQDEIPAAATEVNYTASGMTSGSSSHGSACAEVVYDMAPQAQMYLIKVDDATDLITVKDYCIAQGIKVVSLSLGWDALNFHDGIAYENWFTTAANHPATAVDQATAADILWVSAAGNEQYQHTLIDWRDDGTPDNWLDWNSSQGNLNILWYGGSTTIPADTYIDIYLIWNQWPITSQDFDLRLFRNTGSGWTPVAASEDTQDGDATSYPYEEIFYRTTVAAQYAVGVLKIGATASPSFILRYYGVEPEYFGYGNYSTPAQGSICIPGDTASAFTVGAIDHASYTTGPIEWFSSLGPNNRAFTGGSAVIKPDICGPDFITTVSYGSEDFGGTSAATPHIAGLAALVKGAYPDFTQSQIKQYIETHVYDLGTAGKDNTYGSGVPRLPAPPSVNLAPTDISLSASSINENVAANSTVGTLSTTDPDAGNTFTYTLVAGAGGTDNAAFNISGSSLRITASPDFETKSSYSVRVRTTDQGGLWYEEAFTITVNDVNETIIVSTQSVSVPEGGTETFQVKLSARPAAGITVAVARSSGDSDIAVAGGASLSFTTANWYTWRTVTLSAAQDPDAADGTATITCSGTGFASVDVAATEAEDDTTLTVAAGTGGTAAPAGATVVTKGATTGITATPSAGYVFANWTVTSGSATIANAGAASTTAAITAPATVQANFTANVVNIETSISSVIVPEGGTTTFQVKLSDEPAAGITVAVARSSGDSDIAVAGGASLSFTTANWNTWQTVTLSAAQDADMADGAATIMVSAAGLVPATVTAVEADNTTSGSGTAVRTSAFSKVAGTAVSISVTPAAGTLAWTLVETLPAGYTPSGIAGPNSHWHATTRILSWSGNGDQPTMASYMLSGAPGLCNLLGVATFDGTDFDVTGSPIFLPDGWQPSGWVYFAWPWAYDQATTHWNWFNDGNIQWVYGHPPADGWRLMQASGLAQGWVYFFWPYAYCQGNGAWYYVNEPDVHWVVDMTTGVWRILGYAP